MACPKSRPRSRPRSCWPRQEMLRQWEAGDREVVELWKTMNGWVYEGF